jgi:nucleotide-binding universal stress UspA family protein
MTILCATDFSEQAERASRAAVQLARQFDDAVVLAHVLEPPASNLVELRTDPGGFGQALSEMAAKALGDAAEALRQHGVVVKTRLLRGQPHEAIVTYAKEIQARCIVLGTHGRRAPLRWFVGSVAERTQRLADRPVLVVRVGATGLAEWASGNRPLRVVVGIDLSVASHAPVTWVRALLEKGPCRVDFVHASGALAFAPAGDMLPELDRGLRHKLGDLGRAGEVSLRIIPSWNTEAESLVTYAKAEEADLLIVGTHQRHGLDLAISGSVARDVVRQASMPVLSLPTLEDSASRRADPDARTEHPHTPHS